MAEYNELIGLIKSEITQRREEGCDVEEIENQVEIALQLSNGMKGIELYNILHNLKSLEPAEDFPYIEPSTLEEIRSERPDGPRRVEIELSDEEVFDRIYGAWLGRSAGCALGKPVEGWHKERIESYLKFADAYPLDDYFPVVEGHPEGYQVHSEECTRGNVEYMARDDDMDYTILGLHILESRGLDFTTQDVANTWLNRMPFHLVYTAERVAYRNLVNGISPPESAMHNNPFREWIGAQIRADAWGYVAPGYPEKAAEFAFRDAAVSHVKNGIYGEMLMAAMLSASFITDDIDEVLAIGLSEIPAKCRLAEAMKDILAWSKECDTWQEAWEKINDKYGYYHGVHTINNAAVVLMGLLYAQGDYEKSITISVMGGWDTDCTGATAGSIAGAMLGAEALPDKWIKPLNDRIFSVVRGFNECQISELAKRTHDVAKSVLES